MEIAPITGIRVTPVRKVPPSEQSLSGVFDISFSRSREDSYSGNGKGTGGQDQNDDQDALFDDENHLSRLQRSASGSISAFA
jgi:hypothetical protein